MIVDREAVFYKPRRSGIIWNMSSLRDLLSHMVIYYNHSICLGALDTAPSGLQNS